MSDTEEVEGSCPCLYLEEDCCSAEGLSLGCTCVNSFSSYGCRNCCRVGSLEQRKRHAKRLNEIRIKHLKNH